VKRTADTEPGATGSWTQLSKIMESVTYELNAGIRSLPLSVLSVSAVRFTDFVSVPTDPSDKSLGYFQSSAKGTHSDRLFGQGA